MYRKELIAGRTGRNFFGLQLQRHAGELADTLLDTIEIVFFKCIPASASAPRAGV